MGTTDILTPRLRLRGFSLADLDELQALHSDPAVLRFISARPFTRRETAEALEGYLAPKGGLQRWCWAVEERGRPVELLGWAALRPSDAASEEAEIGYRLRTAAWGRGLASEAALALVDHGFVELGLRRIWGQTMAVHTASRRVMEKAGLSYVRTFHMTFDEPLPGAEEGELEYAITREQWRAAQP